jgi:hypothetical protein
MIKPRHASTPLAPTLGDAGFNGEEWKGLTPEERIRRCLLYAREAALFATQAAPDAKEAYHALSQQWLALATEIERTADMGRPSAHA